MTSLASLRALEQQATPGEWDRAGTDAYDWSLPLADAEFIAALRNAAPALLDIAKDVLEMNDGVGYCVLCGMDRGYGHLDSCGLARLRDDE